MTDATISIGIDSKQADASAKKLTRSLDDVKKRVEENSTEIDKLNKRLDSNGVALKKTAKDTDALSKGITTTTKDTDALSKAIKKTTKDTDALSKGVKKTTKGANDLSEGIKKTTKGAGELSKGVKKATKDTDALSNSMNKGSKGVSNLSKGVGKTTKSTNKFSEGMKKLGQATRLVDGPLGGVASRMQTLGAVLGSGAGVVVTFTLALAALGFTARKFLSNTIVQEKAVAQLEATIRSTGNAALTTSSEMQRLASDLQGVTTFGDEATIAMQSVLLTFTNIGRDILPETTAAIQDLSAKMGQDLKSSAVQIGKALNEPVTGLTALARVGVKFTEGQKKLVESLVDSGDILSAQKIILKELSVEFGGAARAARDTFGGSLTALSNAFNDLFEAGPKTAKILQSAVESLINSIGGLVKTVEVLSIALGITLVGSLLKFVASVAASNVALLANAGFLASNTLLSVALGVAYLDASAATGVLATASAVLTGGLAALRIAFLGIILNPLFLFLAAATAAFIYLSDSVDGTIAQLRRFGIEQVDSNKALIEFDSLVGQAAGQQGDLKLRTLASAVAIREENLALLKRNSNLALARIKQIETLESTDKLRKETQTLAKSIRENAAAYKTLEKQTSATRAEYDKLLKVQKDEEKALTALNEAVESANKFIEKSFTPMQKLTMEIEKQKETLKLLGPEYGELSVQLAAAIGRSEIELEKLRNKADKTGKSVVKIFSNIAGSIQKSFSDVFKRIFTDGKIGFKDFASDIKNIFINAISEMATLALAKPLLIPIVTGIGGSLGLGGDAIAGVTGQLGGKPTAGIGGIGDLLSAGKSLIGLSGSGIQNTLANFGIGAAQGPTLSGAPLSGGFDVGSALSGSSFLSGAVGGAIGNFGANAIFGDDRGIGASLGGGAGAIAGQLLIPVPVLGAVIGSFVGNALGGLFGGGNPTVASEFGGTTSATGIESTFGSKGADTSFAKGVSDAFGGIVGGLGGLSGVDVSSQNIRGGLNTNQFGGGFLDIGGEIIKFDEASEESLNNALAQATVKMLEFGDVTNGSVLTALENITTEGRTLEEVLGDIEFAANFDKLFAETQPAFTALELQMQNINTIFENAVDTANRLGLSEEKLTEARLRAERVIRTDFNDSIQDQILGIQAPSQLALRELERQFAELRRNAIAVGGDLGKVEELFGIKRLALLEQFQAEQLGLIDDGFDKQLDNLRSSFEDTVNDLTQFRNSLGLNSNLSGTNREGRAVEADRQLDELARRIASGDAEALNDLQGVSTSALEAALDYYGPTEAFLERLSKVDDIIESAKGVAENQFDAELAILQQTRLSNTVGETTLSELERQTQILFAIADQTSASFLASQNIGSNSLLRPGEDPSNLSRINVDSNISDQLTRQLQVQASGGAFDFSTSSGSFADFVRGSSGGRAAGEQFLQLLSGVGGSTGVFKERFGFAKGTGNSRFSGMAIVGEEGPELVNFDRPGQIISNGKSQALVGGGQSGKAVESAMNGLRQQSAKQTVFLGGKFDAMIAAMEEVKDELAKRPV